MLWDFCPRQGAFLSDSATINRYLPEKDLLNENQKHPFCNINVIPASHFCWTFGNENVRYALIGIVTGIYGWHEDMHDKMMAAVNEPDPDKAFAKGMIAHHEGAIAMAETELKYGKDPEMRKLAQDIIKAQKGEIEQMNKWLGSQK